VRDPDLASLFRVFLKLGCLGFGGPAAHLALMEREIVRNRGWLAPGEFLDLIGAANLIPGPNSTEVALYVGLRRAGWRGLLVAGAGFILPAVAMVLLCGASIWCRRGGDRRAAGGTGGDPGPPGCRASGPRGCPRA